MFWCFNSAGEKWDAEKTCRVARELGCVSVELIDPEHWGVLKRHGLTCAIAPNGMPGMPFMRGFNNPKYHEEVTARTRKTVDACADAGFPNVIGFSGFKWRTAEDPKSGEISREEGADNCVKAIKELAGYLEKRKVTLCLEHLNTRDASHPMKGHPGYQGDDLDWLAGVIRRVGSERVKLLFDVYHVQIMHGDLVRRLEQNKDVLGHVHTAGNPGRGELDERQEIQYGRRHAEARRSALRRPRRPRVHPDARPARRAAPGRARLRRVNAARFFCRAGRTSAPRPGSSLCDARLLPGGRVSGEGSYPLPPGATPGPGTFRRPRRPIGRSRPPQKWDSPGSSPGAASGMFATPSWGNG